jgi:hypothetical protein
MSSPGGSVGTRALHGEGDERLCILPGRPWGIRSAIIYEDAEVIGLMDICPIRPGHAQITPREHFDHVSGAVRSPVVIVRIGRAASPSRPGRTRQ